MSVPLDAPLPPSVTTWAVPTEMVAPGAVTHTYGDVHEMMHRDITLGNDFRKERIKLLITVATGVFALMISFNKDLFSGRTTGPALAALLAGFISLLLSILCGIYHFQAWEDFYLAHRDLSTGLWIHRTAAGDPALQAEGRRRHNRARNRITEFRYDYRHWDRLQTTFLLIGLGLVTAYVGIQAVKPAAETPAVAHPK